MKENRGAYIVFLIVIGGFVFLFNKWTPLFCDDWIYNFIYGTQTQIQSLSDVVYSQYIHYFKVNGRLFPHFFIQLFDGLLGKGIFNIVNTLFFVAFLVLLSYTLKDAFKSFFVSSVLALIFIFLLLPGFNNCFLWLSGSCNYLWVAVSLFNILLNRSSFHPYLYPLLFIFGVICGWSNEALALGLGAGYFIYYVLHRDKLCVSRIILLLGFYFGLLFLVISPGSIHRAIGLGVERISVTETVHNMLSALFSMTNIRIFPCLLIALLVFAFIDRKEAVVFIRSNIVLVTSIIVTFIFILWTQHDSDQSRFGFELFSLILLLRLISI